MIFSQKQTAMKIDANTPDEYVAQLPEERKAAFQKLRALLREHLPSGFEESMSYGMVGYVVPHSLYPAGYHCNPKEPLPFISLGNQKNYIALYHSGMYADPSLLTWFTEAYPKYSPTKLDMGKSCIRFKKVENIPYDLLVELAQKMTPSEWISLYEKEVKR